VPKCPGEVCKAKKLLNSLSKRPNNCKRIKDIKLSKLLTDRYILEKLLVKKELAKIDIGGKKSV